MALQGLVAGGADCAGVAGSGNAMTRFLGQVGQDPLEVAHMQAMGKAGPGAMGGMNEGFEQAWAAGPRPPMMGPMRPMGPMGMQGALAQRMQAAQESAFMSMGPEAMGPGAMGEQWGAEFGRQMGPRPMGPRPMGPGAQGPQWANEFARPPAPDMEAAFQQAQREAAMEAAFAQSGKDAAMEAAFAAAGDPMEAAWKGESPQDAMEKAFAEAGDSWAEEFAQPGADWAKSFEDERSLESARAMVETLRSSGNPKMQSSQFVNFIDKVGKGELQFKDQQVVDRDGKEVAWEELYNSEPLDKAWGQGQTLDAAWDASAKPLDAAWAQAQGPTGMDAAWADAGKGKGKGLDAAWDAAKPPLEAAWDAADPMQRAWDEPGLEELFEGGALERAWGQGALDEAWGDLDADKLEQLWEKGGFDSLESAWSKTSAYEFQSPNPFLDDPNPLQTAQRLLAEGKDHDALLALEAEVQKRPDSSEGWRLLGETHASLDDDPQAILCLKQGHEADPYNLDSLLALGVSLTNEVEHHRALGMLRTWIENHEEYGALVNGPPPKHLMDLQTHVVSLFEQAVQQNPLDADTHVALAVVQHIRHNYDAAVSLFKQAAAIAPGKFTIWNKLGATLANSGKPQAALKAYHQALQIKPNYTRAWSNLAIAHMQLQEHEDAARFYLTALQLSPSAKHLWRNVRTCAHMLGNPELVSAAELMDVDACCRLIQGVTRPEDMPAPNPNFAAPVDSILAQI